MSEKEQPCNHCGNPAGFSKNGKGPRKFCSQKCSQTYHSKKYQAGKGPATDAQRLISGPWRLYNGNT